MDEDEYQIKSDEAYGAGLAYATFIRDDLRAKAETFGDCSDHFYNAVYEYL